MVASACPVSPPQSMDCLPNCSARGSPGPHRCLRCAGSIAQTCTGRHCRPGTAKGCWLERVHLGGPLTWQVTRLLCAGGLVSRHADETWKLTERGRTAHVQRDYSQVRLERRSFSFLESLQTGAAPRFVRLQPRSRLAWPAGDHWQFDLAQLDACLLQSDDWKVRRGFPAEVHDIVRPASAIRDDELGAESIPEWQRPSSYTRSPTRGTSLTAGKDGRRHFMDSISAAGLASPGRRSCLHVGRGLARAVADLTEQVPLPSWRLAWQAWLQSRGVIDDVSSCRLERSHALRVGHRPPSWSDFDP